MYKTINNKSVTKATIAGQVKQNKATSAFNCTLGQMDLTDIQRALHPTAAEYTFFISTENIIDIQGRSYDRPKK